ncbi:MAG: P-type conjugative transfer protein TrbL, partial [Pseudomonadota bacterium]
SGSSASKTNPNKSSNPIQTAGSAGRVAVDAVANLASGAKDVAKNKFGDLKESAMQAVSESTGGKIAAAIRRTGSEDQQNLTKNQDNDIDTEISAFRDGSE